MANENTIIHELTRQTIGCLADNAEPIGASDEQWAAAAKTEEAMYGFTPEEYLTYLNELFDILDCESETEDDRIKMWSKYHKRERAAGRKLYQHVRDQIDYNQQMGWSDEATTESFWQER